MKMSKKTMLLTSSAVVVTVLSFTAVSAVFAAESSITTQAKTTMQQASDIVTNSNTGCTIDEIELENENGVATYEIDITNSNNTKSEVEVNAENGMIVETKAKTDKQSEKKESKNKETEKKEIEETAKTALEIQHQTLDKNWVSMTDTQKEQVYALKDAEFAAEIVNVKAHVAAGYNTQAEVDIMVSQIQAQKAAMRASGTAPNFDSIVNLPTV